MVPGATSVLVLMKVQTAALQARVKPAVGGALTGGTGGAGSMVMVLVLVWLRPLASWTVRLTLKSPAVLYLKDAVAVFASASPSPSKSQLHSVTSASSVLVLAKLQASSMVHGGTAKFATGAVFSGGVMPPSPLHAQASTIVPVTKANRPIDRIESSQPKERQSA
jgi:hypothetical protein